MDGAGRSLLRAEVLGPVRAWSGRQRLDLGPPLQRAVFVVLACCAGRTVSRHELIDAVWGADAPLSAENGVHTYIRGLRRVLEPARAARAPGQILISTPTGYELLLAPDSLDVTAFGQQLAEGRRLRAAGDLVGMVGLADSALALWQGAPLSGIPGPFAEIERTRLSELRLGAIEERAEAMLDLGRHAELATELPAVVSENPFRERLRGLLMLALYRRGRQADALAVFHDSRRILAAELGIEPSHDLRRLHQQVLCGDASLDPPSAVIIEPRRPSREWRPAELPHDVAGFTNRAAELAEMRALLAVGDERPGPGLVIIAIDGPAGIGKTAVAVHAAHQVASGFPDGQLYLDLQGFHPHEPALPPDEALGHLLRAFQIDPHQIPHDLNGRVGRYRSVLSGKRALVILDNAASADQVRPLLPGSASSAVIVTSRNRLGSLVVRDGARRVTLRALSAHHALDVIERIAGHRRPAAEPAAAAELARLCGYLPLALRVAAERVAAHPQLSLSELVNRLAVEHDRLDLLAAEEETAAIRAVLSWSYRALPPPASRLFRLLALHPGTGISAPAASALAMTNMAETRRLLDDLANAHLLEETGPGRYQFHDLVRLYAREVVAAAETGADRDAATRRLLQWYLHTADSACAVLNPQRPRVQLNPPKSPICPLTFADQDNALQWCEEECANMVAAVHLAAGIGDHTTAWQLPMAMFDFFYLRKQWTDWIGLDRLALDSAKHLGDEFGEGAILTSLGVAYFDQRRFSDAIDCLRQALPIWRAIGFPQGEAVTLDSLGAGYRDTGHLSEALDCLVRALMISRDVGDRWGEAITLHNLGDTYRGLGQLDEAINHLQQSRSVRSQIGDLYGLAWTLHDLGSVSADLQRYDDAIDYYEQALAIRCQVGDRHGEARTLRRLGQIYCNVGPPGMASSLWKQAQAIFEELGDHPRTAQIRECLSNL